MRSVWTGLAAVGLLALAAGCGGSATPTQPSASVTPAAVRTGSAPGAVSAGASSLSAPGTARALPGGGGASMAAESMLTERVAFPPRNEPFTFRQALEAKYRDGLRRGATSSFVDIEGTIVWTQEYLRYRVNQCGHSDAVFRVFAQIDGFGIPPVCGATESVAFPPRQEPFDFRLQLEVKYRDGLRRGASSTFVDTEGDIVWTQEYLRYRVSGCTHFDAQDKVFAQIDGRGVQPDCRPSTPTGSGQAFIEWTTTSITCNCTSGSIRLMVNGTQVGTMGCRESRRFSITPGTYTIQACDGASCWPRVTQTLRANDIYTQTLTCTSGASPTSATGGWEKVCS